ncbi:MAG TPA: MarR family transcriptional regulator [Burkholderiales bacterium]|nr:MarR family transcriptional regulator [Burkholderiales bacterium]
MAAGKHRSPLKLDTHEYEALAAFRYALRSFMRFSEVEAEKRGLTAQHYQALLTLRACPEGHRLTINDLALQLMIRHNSAVGLADRLTKQGLVTRESSPQDGRKVYLRLTAKGNRILEKLAEVHREELQRIGQQLEELLQQITHATKGRSEA